MLSNAQKANHCAKGITRESDSDTGRIRPGMTVARAQALVPDLAVRDAELEADSAALEKLGLWALRLYSPLVAIDPPDGLVIDTTGAAHLHGGEDAMLRDMVARLATAGITARVAMADSWGQQTRSRATSDSAIVVPSGESDALLQRPPLAFLRLPDNMIDQLRRLGFERVCDIVSQPRGARAYRGMRSPEARPACIASTT
jgi:protein ImuB